ncbi:helix-turn-helix domain-containing protein [Falsiroseomonas sp.]|uniref:helix-turn-helix domain-containing protein n=1 Tax=Falsiroseomonas sp. TaxID=2870721 RepID=UPI0027266A58|nr:helix-turn-helix transcriptional regulator [Falsiroseomonas sp.]MDO9499660.1 helix-turn-helix transcriptional regulator [Falsiroseomonas sp.]
MAFGAAVRTRRLALGISQEDLAHRSDLDRTYVGGIERGERNLSLLNLLAIARALDFTADELMRAFEMEVKHGSSNQG